MSIQQNGQKVDPIIAEKVEQAIGLLRESNLDVWLLFAQETGYEKDPVYPLLFGDRDLGAGFLLLTANGRKIAIVSGLDQMIPKSTGVWDEVVVYEKNPYDTLRQVLTDINPNGIGINYSENSPSADGITYGQYLRLVKALEDTPFARRLTSTERLAATLRSIKTPAEIEAIRSAILKTNTVFDRLKAYLKPGVTGIEIFRFVQEQIISLGSSCGWSRYNCPVVTVGPVDYMGHTPPDERRLEKGWLLQVDLGVRYQGYCSDFQRMFYVLEDGEDEPPEEVQRLFAIIRRGIDSMIGEIKPGVRNDFPSSVGFAIITSAGYPEPKYSAGHQLGRAVHDGGVGLLDYRHPRPEYRMAAGQVYTVEGLETRLEGRGWVSLEEDVVVTPDGCRVLTDEQRELWLIRER